VVVASTYPSNDLLGVTGTQDEAWAAAWQRSIGRLSAPGTEVFFVNDTPWQAGSAPDCLSGHLDRPSACARDRGSAINLPERRTLIEDTVRAAGARIIDPAPWFCTAEKCPSVIGNILVYRDQHHITTAYSRLLAPLLAEALHP